MAILQGLLYRVFIIVGSVIVKSYCIRLLLYKVRNVTLQCSALIG